MSKTSSYGKQRSLLLYDLASFSTQVSCTDAGSPTIHWIKKFL